MISKEKIEENIRDTNENFRRIFNSKVTGLIILVVSVVIFCLSNGFSQYNIAIIAMSIFWLYSVFYSISNLKKRYIFFIMNIMFFTFIISRPVIGMFRGTEWWYFSEDAVWKALNAIFISEIFIFIGNMLAEKYLKDKSSELKESTDKSRIIAIILFGLIILTGIVNLSVEITKYINMKDVDYALNYTNNVVSIPKIVNIISSMFSYTVFAYLATMPKKKYSIIVLGAYILLAIPSLLLGARNGFVLRLMFSIVYILIRQIEIPQNETWINKKIKVIALLLIPILIIFLGAYNYIREDKVVKSNSPVALIVDFFQLQGTTFDTICEGFEYENTFKNQPNVISYTFGDIIDYIIHNTISQKLFGTEDLGNGNSLEMVNKSNSLAHKLSYEVLGEYSYLSGHGRGTSYIIETYMDAGMLWVAIYSCIIGGYFVAIGIWIRKENFLIRYIIITTLSQIFILPRYSASGFFSFIVTPQFWSIMALILLVRLVIKYNEKRRKNGK